MEGYSAIRARHKSDGPVGPGKLTEFQGRAMSPDRHNCPMEEALTPAPSPHGEPAPNTAVLAGGGVVWRRTDEEVQVALVHRPKYDDWSFPKGKLRSGEPALAGAWREVNEETGLRTTVGPRLPTSGYQTRQGPKVVEYWAMHAAGPGGSPFGDEVDIWEWLSLVRARQRLSYERDLDVLDALLPAISRIRTVVLVVRHASAGDPKAWKGDDCARPLDEAGRREADALRWALAAFSPELLLSADRTRCVQTLEPLAAALGSEIEEDPLFGEDAYLTAPGRVRQRFLELSASGKTIAICSQGNVIQDLLPVLGVRVPSKGGVEKGSLWALFFGAGELVASDYYPTLLG